MRYNNTAGEKIGQEEIYVELDERTKKRIATICEATGWDEAAAKAAMDKAKALGITNGKYVANKGWDFNEEELRELKEILVLQEQKQKESELWHAQVVCEKTGWSLDKALRLMKVAKQKGYSNKLFVTKALWRKTEEEIEALPKYEKKVSAAKAKDVAERNAKAREYREMIMAEMGWSLGKARLEAKRANVLCGCTGIEFYLFQIYKRGSDAGNTFITAEYNARMKTRYCDWGGKTHQYFENKGIFNEAFKPFIRRKWFLSKTTSYNQFREMVAGLNKIIAKPLNGIEGIGIRIFDLVPTEECYRRVYDEIASGPPSIVEQFITQHPAINEIYPNAVNTIRIMSFLENGEGKILNAVMKFATKSNVDNYYQGSLAVAVDEKTGIVRAEGVDYAGNLYTTHPYSGKTLKGFQVPHWDKVIALIRDAAKVHPELPYIGWDIAITPEGPEIVEGNHNQGAYLCQYPFAVCLQEGRRHTIDPYLWFD